MRSMIPAEVKARFRLPARLVGMTAAALSGSLGLSLADFLQRTTAVIASPVARPGGPVLLAA